MPSLIPLLERDGHLQLGEEQRSQLLAMSVRTAERLLSTQRWPTAHGFSTTKPGTMLLNPLYAARDLSKAEESMTILLRKKAHQEWMMLSYAPRSAKEAPPYWSRRARANGDSSFSFDAVSVGWAALRLQRAFFPRIYAYSSL